jgi:hypothetical protein
MEEFFADMGPLAAAFAPPPCGSVPEQAVLLALADALGDVGPGARPDLVAIFDVQAREKVRHLGRMKSMSRLEDGRHCLELSLVHGGR